MKLATFLILSLCISLILTKEEENVQTPKNSLEKSHSKPMRPISKTSDTDNNKVPSLNKEQSTRW